MQTQSWPVWGEITSLTCDSVAADVRGGGRWQRQWEIPPVASLTVWQFVYLCLCMWQNKRPQSWLCGHSPTLRPPSLTSAKTLISTYTTQQEINTLTPPSSLLSLPRLMRELLLLAEGLLLTPSRSQMIVFAAWGPDPTSPDPLTGTVEPFHQEFDIKTGRMIKRHPEHREFASFSIFFFCFFFICL